jgi:hypothetical protein
VNKRAVTLSIAAVLAGPAGANTLTVGIDVSASNPLLASPAYASRVGQAVATKIDALQPGDTVVVRQLGDRSVGNAISETLKITNRLRADKVGPRVGAYIAALPSHPDVARGATNIVGFFELGAFDCANGGEIVVATDGVESSELVSGRSFLAGKALPPPPKGLLAGCTVTMIGLGQSAENAISLKQAAHIVTAWTAWMKAAGAVFRPIVNP